MTNRPLKDRANTLKSEINARFAHGNKHRLKTVEALEIMARCDGERSRHAPLARERAPKASPASTGVTPPYDPYHEAMATDDPDVVLVPASQILVGDHLDLEGDPYADPRRSPALASEYMTVESVTLETFPPGTTSDRGTAKANQYVTRVTAAGGIDRVQQRFDEMREKVVPSESFSVTMWNLRHDDEGGEDRYLVDVEIEGGRLGPARWARFVDTEQPKLRWGMDFGALYRMAATPEDEARPCVAISIEGFDVIGFPPGHMLRRRKYPPVVLGTPGRSVGLVINAPDVFERPDFRRWLNDPERTTATWHRRGMEPGDYSDTYVLVDSGYDGDSSDMPQDVWQAICDAVYAAYADGDDQLPHRIDYAVCVRLTNLAD